MMEDGTMLLCENCLNYLVAQGYMKYVFAETLDLDDIAQANEDGEIEHPYNCEWCEDTATLYKVAMC